MQTSPIFTRRAMLSVAIFFGMLGFQLLYSSNLNPTIVYAGSTLTPTVEQPEDTPQPTNPPATQVPANTAVPTTVPPTSTPSSNSSNNEPPPTAAPPTAVPTQWPGASPTPVPPPTIPELGGGPSTNGLVWVGLGLFLFILFNTSRLLKLGRQE